MQIAGIFFGECRDIASFSVGVVASNSDCVPRVTVVSATARSAARCSDGSRCVVRGDGIKGRGVERERTPRARGVGVRSPSYRTRK